MSNVVDSSFSSDVSKPASTTSLQASVMAAKHQYTIHIMLLLLLLLVVSH